jgi:hypothetical protein
MSRPQPQPITSSKRYKIAAVWSATTRKISTVSKSVWACLRTYFLVRAPRPGSTLESSASNDSLVPRPIWIPPSPESRSFNFTGPFPNSVVGSATRHAPGTRMSTWTSSARDKHRTARRALNTIIGVPEEADEDLLWED